MLYFTDKNCAGVIILGFGKQVGIENERLFSLIGFISKQSSVPIVIYIGEEKKSYAIRSNTLYILKVIKYSVQNTERVFTLNIRPFFWMFSYS